MKLLWLLLIGMLTVVIGVQWLVPVEEPPVPSYTKPKAPAEKEPNLLAQADRAADFPAMAQFHSIQNRPLFFEGRRPPPKYVPEPPAVKPGKPAREVVAVQGSLTAVIRVGDESYAMLQGVGKVQNLTRVKVGEDVEGWKVATIHDDKVVLKNGEKTHEILLRSYKAVPLPKSKPAAKSGAKPAARSAATIRALEANKKAIEARKKKLSARNERFSRGERSGTTRNSRNTSTVRRTANEKDRD